MAANTATADDGEAGDLELLRSGNFADVEVVCGDRSWNCHRAILVPRSVWFRKALAGPFQEASTKKIILNDENPIYVDLALRYIYGRGLSIESSVSEEHFVEHCVLLWHTADFLLLDPLKSSVWHAVYDHCDKQMKHLCIIGIDEKWWAHSNDKSKLQPWALDIVLGLRNTYKWNVEGLKAMLMEFIWVARTMTFGYQSHVPTLRHHLGHEATMAFMDDLIHKYASSRWMESSIWAPDRRTVGGTKTDCGLCGKPFLGRKEKREGIVRDPFTFDFHSFSFTRGWCPDCSKGDIIPWRV